MDTETKAQPFVHASSGFPIRLVPDKADRMKATDKAFLKMLRSSVAGGLSGGLKVAADYCQGARLDLNDFYPVSHRMQDLCVSLDDALYNYRTSLDSHIPDVFFSQVAAILEEGQIDEHGYSLWHHAFAQSSNLGLFSGPNFLEIRKESEAGHRARFSANNASGLPADALALRDKVDAENVEIEQAYEELLQQNNGKDPILDTTGHTVWEEIVLLDAFAAALLLDLPDFNINEHRPLHILEEADDASAKDLEMLVLPLMTKHPQLLREEGGAALTRSILNQAITDGNLCSNDQSDASRIVQEIDLVGAALAEDALADNAITSPAL